MKTLFLAAALLTPTALHAQDDELKIPDVTIPMLPATGADIAAFTPRGWTVEQQVTGDLNKDGRPDLAFVLHDTDPHNIVHNKNGLGVDELDTNPRILAIAFANPTGAGYTLAAQNSKLIPRWTAPNLDDYFSEDAAITIARGALNVSLHYFASAGGWDTGTTTFTFRYQNNRFELIGFQNDNHNRGSGQDTTTSANYSTHQLLITTSNDQDNKPSRTKQRHLPQTPNKTLDTIGDGMEFEVPGQ